MITWVYFKGYDGELISVMHMLEDSAPWTWGDDIHTVCGYYLLTVGQAYSHGHWRWAFRAEDPIIEFYKQHDRVCPTCLNFSYLKDLQ